ncbi:hypothetical protein KHA80_06170 [Anaerobacillus sp. HL2]|nr:hypothetical protein KHA80_06170 [Anaerobacillus sp. HL2]
MLEYLISSIKKLSSGYLIVHQGDYPIVEGISQRLVKKTYALMKKIIIQKTYV